MKTLTYSAEVEVPVEELWTYITDPEKYKQWIKAFSADSYMKWKWALWETVYFLDDNMWGTKAKIIEFKKFKIIKAEHTAMVTKDWSEDTTWEYAKNWVGTIETYLFEKTWKGSKMTLEIYTHKDFIPMYNDSCPKAMEYIGEIFN